MMGDLYWWFVDASHAASAHLALVRSVVGAWGTVPAGVFLGVVFCMGLSLVMGK